MHAYSLVLGRSKERLVSTVRTYMRIYGKPSVNAFVNNLNHMARCGTKIHVVYVVISGRTRRYYEFLGLKWPSMQ